jgi:DNA-directed RNA polymerase specialized sigma subunit
MELPKFTKTEDELETLLDKWMFVLKNLTVLDDRPEALRERVFRRLFRIAEIEQLSEAERIVYRESQKIYWDYMSSIRSAEKIGREKEALEKDAVIREKDAIIQEKEAVIRELEEKEITTVKSLFGKGLSTKEISEIMRLDVRQISKIVAEI